LPAKYPATKADPIRKRLTMSEVGIGLPLSIAMPEIPTRRHGVPHPLLDFLRFGKTTFLLPRPQDLPAGTDLEHPASSRNQGYATQLFLESGQ
jgi:hypothetical protein